MDNYNEPETKKVTGVQFSIMSPQEIRDRSVIEITKHETFDITRFIETDIPLPVDPDFFM